MKNAELNEDQKLIEIKLKELIQEAKIDSKNISAIKHRLDLGVMGAKYCRGLMVIGRAPNWGGIAPEQNVFESTDTDKLTKNLAKAFGDKESLVTLLTNNTNYNPNRSQFWNFAGRLADKMGLIEQEVKNPLEKLEYLAWSNLYKLAPANSNPNKEARKLQREIARKILDIEIKAFNPKIILFLTGWDWFIDFVVQSEFEGAHFKLHGKKDYKGWKGQIDGRQVWVLPHPQGKPFIKWVDEVQLGEGKS